MKRCGKCCIEKDESEFHISKRRPDGLGNRCKLCKTIEGKEYRLKYPEKFKERYSVELPKWRAENKEKCKEYSKHDRERKKQGLIQSYKSLEEINFLKEMAEKNQIEWKSLSKERKKEWRKEYRKRDSVKFKDKARGILENAILGEKIRRPNKCEKCNVECIPDAHHTDYLKPLYVIWLCKPCHVLEHN